MTNHLKKHAFLSPFPRLFTRGGDDAYEAIPFLASESFGDEETRALAAPATWGDAAVAVMSEAACESIPADLRAIEENTVPSWLWRHKPAGARHATEGDARSIINRIVGSAGAKAWKLGLFSNEKQARRFYDEARFAFLQRYIALAPDVIAPIGLNWAYGIEEKSQSPRSLNKDFYQISNAEIDTVLKSKSKPRAWKKIFAANKSGKEIHLRLSDITGDWHSSVSAPAQAVIDVMALRHNDGGVNTDMVRHCTRLLVILLDLHERDDITIGIANLATLLMALGLNYDSDAGRALAASLTALITAEAVAVSAEMAALRGASEEFIATREDTMRGLRNHRRAAYGDTNDYEKLSVLPAPLPLKNCPDLALVAETQRRWDEALEMARAFGLRRIVMTDLTPNPALTVFMESASQGLEPLRNLTLLQQDEAGNFLTVLHPAVAEAMMRLDYPRNSIKAIAHHITGTHTLHKAPAINPSSLRARGLNETAIEKIEAYIPCVNSLRLAITPWIIGVDYCRDILKIPTKKLEAPRFDLLHHLGFSDADIQAADLFCYGHKTARNAKILNIRHRGLFACGSEISTEARLRMASSVQSFISGDTGVIVTLPVTQSVVGGTEMALSAWRRGLKSLAVIFDPSVKAPIARVAATRRIMATGHVQRKAPPAPPRLSRSGKSPVGLAVKKASGLRRGNHKH